VRVLLLISGQPEAAETATDNENDNEDANDHVYLAGRIVFLVFQLVLLLLVASRFVALEIWVTFQAALPQRAPTSALLDNCSRRRHTPKVETAARSEESLDVEAVALPWIHIFVHLRVDPVLDLLSDR